MHLAVTWTIGTAQAQDIRLFSPSRPSPSGRGRPGPVHQCSSTIERAKDLAPRLLHGLFLVRSVLPSSIRSSGMSAISTALSSCSMARAKRPVSTRKPSVGGLGFPDDLARLQPLFRSPSALVYSDPTRHGPGLTRCESIHYPGRLRGRTRARAVHHRGRRRVYSQERQRVQSILLTAHQSDRASRGNAVLGFGRQFGRSTILSQRIIIGTCALADSAQQIVNAPAFRARMPARPSGRHRPSRSFPHPEADLPGGCWAAARTRSNSAARRASARDCSRSPRIWWRSDFTE